jgi:hypothetical protein
MASKTFRWTGRMGRGYMKQYRQFKREDAEDRNAAAQPVELHECGHRHGSGRGCAA